MAAIQESRRQPETYRAGVSAHGTSGVPGYTLKSSIFVAWPGLVLPNPSVRRCGTALCYNGPS